VGCCGRLRIQIVTLKISIFIYHLMATVVAGVTEKPSNYALRYLKFGHLSHYICRSVR